MALSSPTSRSHPAQSRHTIMGIAEINQAEMAIQALTMAI
jgi:hypothetical protein